MNIEIIYSSRKTIAIQVTRDGRVLVRSPRRCSRSYIDDFVSNNENWVLKHLARAKELGEQKESAVSSHPPLSATDRSRYIEIARDILPARQSIMRRIMGVSLTGASPSVSRRPAGEAAAVRQLK